jgi:hypothetical protein
MRRINNYSLIHLENCQVKSIEKAKLLCKLIDTIEKEFGIKETEISFKNNFICPDIDLSLLSNSKIPMEKLVGKLLIKLDKQLRGNKSKYRKLKKPDFVQTLNPRSKKYVMVDRANGKIYPNETKNPIKGIKVL